MKQYVFPIISMSLIMTLNASDEMHAIELAAFKKLMQEKVEQQRKEAEQWYVQHAQNEKIVVVPAGEAYAEVESVTTPLGTTVRATREISSNKPMVSRPQQHRASRNQSSQYAPAQSWTINPADGIIYEDDGRGNVRKIEASEDLACRDQLEELAAWSKKLTEESHAKQRAVGLFKDRNIYIAQNKESKKYRIMKDSYDLNDDEKLFSMCSGQTIEEVKREFGITE